jgi:hypothetical protein
MGDFNDLLPSWIERSLSLKQVVREKTTQKSVIDLIFTDISDFYSDPVTLPSLGKSTHFCVHWCPREEKRIGTKRIFSSRPLTESGKELFAKWAISKNWKSLYENCNVNDMYRIFSTEIRIAYDVYFPEKTVTVNSADKPWVNSRLKRLIRKRNRLHKKGKIGEASKLRNQVVYECRLAEKSYGSKMNELMTTNPAGYYKGIRLLTGSSVRQSVSVYDESGNKLDANAINKYFASICRSNPPISSVPPLAVPSEIPVIFPHEVAKVLERLDPNKATYPGDIPATLYKENAAFLAEPLTAFLNQCILSGTFPDDLKKKQ